jgi:hypothetical protein
MSGRLVPFFMLASALAQTPSMVEVLADKSQIVVGETLQARAIVRDASGNALPNAAVTWSVNNAAASISSTGLVSTKGLATIRITARSGSASGEAAFQTIPLRIEVLPRGMDIVVGTAMKFSAYAYDMNGNPIPNVTYAWSVTNQRQGGSSLATIDSSGTFTAKGEGGVWVWATYNYNENFSGLQTRWVAYSAVNVNAPRTYEVKKLFSTLGQTRTSWKLRPKQTMIYSTDDGGLYFNASLSGLANALVGWNGGRLSVVSGGGVPRFGRGSTALEFRTHSITRDGQVLSYEDTNINGAEINLGNVTDGVQPFLNNNVPLGATEATSGMYINRNSLTSSGYKIVRANFRYPAETVSYVGLFRGRTGVNEMLIGTKDTLPEFSTAFTIDTDFGIAGDGTAFYSLTSGSNRIFYRHDGNGRQRLIGVGDPVQGSKIRSFLGGRTYAPATWFDEDGTTIVGVTLEDNSQWYLQFAPDGTMTSLRLNSQIGILYRHPSQGTLIYANPYNNQGNGAYLWQGGSLKQVMLFSKKQFGQTIQEIESGTIDNLGNITLMLRGDGTALMVARMDAEPYILVSEGDDVNVELPVNLFTLIGGARTGPPHAQAGGNSGSIARFNNGDWEATLGIGARLFGTTMWFGGSYGSTYNMRKSPNGDIYAITGAGIARIKPDTSPELLVPFPLRLENNLTVNSPGQLDVNSNGDILFSSSTSGGDNRFFIWKGGQAAQILVHSTSAATASTIDGRIASSFDSFAIDDAGRVIAQLRFRNVTVPVICVWDGKSWTTAALPNSTKVGKRAITSSANIVRAAGNHLLATLTADTGTNILVEWNGSSWDLLVDIDAIMPNGQNANSISALDVNTRGDALFQFSNGVNSLVVRRNGQLNQVQNLFKPTSEGDWLIRINAMDLRDDGTVYFLAVNQEDDVVLYQAAPL